MYSFAEGKTKKQIGQENARLLGAALGYEMIPKDFTGEPYKRFSEREIKIFQEDTGASRDEALTYSKENNGDLLYSIIQYCKDKKKDILKV